MRSAFRSPGVPSTREAGTASLVGRPSNRPMRAGFAENSFLINAGPRTHDRGKVLRGRGGSIYPLNGGANEEALGCPLSCGLQGHLVPICCSGRARRQNRHTRASTSERTVVGETRLSNSSARERNRLSMAQPCRLRGVLQVPSFTSSPGSAPRCSGRLLSSSNDASAPAPIVQYDLHRPSLLLHASNPCPPFEGGAFIRPAPP